eukprot:XP_013967926.1 sodium/nucleoside cotransporter 1 isoform X4 [Canis lupus familiaris]
MEDDAPRRRESISLTFVANGLENKGVELLESLEEGRIPGHDSGPEEGGDNRNEASPEPFSGWRSLQPALRATRRFCREHAQLFQWICTGLLSTDTHRDHACHLSACFAFAAFLLTAGLLDFQRALALFVLTCVVLTFLAHSLLRRLLGPRLLRCVKPLGHCRLSFWVERGLALTAFLGLILWLILDTSQRPEQLVSFAGICVFIGLLFACSKHHYAVSWRAVFWGLGLQFVLGLFVIRTEPGFIAFQWMGNQIQIFLSYTDVGSSFVFGEAMVKGVFAFQTEAPLLIQPYLADMTLSEIHAVMTGGYATIAGSLLGAYISFGMRKLRLREQVRCPSQDSSPHLSDCKTHTHSRSSGLFLKLCPTPSTLLFPTPLLGTNPPSVPKLLLVQLLSAIHF